MIDAPDQLSDGQCGLQNGLVELAGQSIATDSVGKIGSVRRVDTPLVGE